MGRLSNGKRIAVARSALFRHGYFQIPPQILPSQRRFAAHDILGRSFRHNRAPMYSSTRAQVKHVIRGKDGVLVMFHHDNGIAEVAKPLQCRKQFFVIPLVQADAGFIEDIEHPDQPAAHLCGQPDPLGFPPGQRTRVAVQAQVVQPDAVQKTQALPNFLEDPLGDFRPGGIQP
ncbi:MAG: hypothetical protein BWY09_02440 [Candidatus Hydrogenedentes bacterium ADurb.Bin179]|nr:MAG: hypothetical protein BWY09_02440 [Candidatus Hydrogenedentes bacterium ADurb.Bin179]